MITSKIFYVLQCSNEMLIIIILYFIQQLLAVPFHLSSDRLASHNITGLRKQVMQQKEGGGGEELGTTEKFEPSYVDGNYSDVETVTLATYDNALINDREHYYRAPGGKCNTTEHIVSQLKHLQAAGKLTRLVHHELERGKCLWYTRTECTAVPSHSHAKTKEFRCTCQKGRTWELGACLAYQGQPCLWPTDCVFNAKCEPPDDGDVDDDDDDDSDDKENTAGEHSEKHKEDDKTQAVENLLYKNIEFDMGTCICTNFSACQREAVYPPFHEDNESAKLEALLPMFILPIFHVNAFK